MNNKWCVVLCGGTGSRMGDLTKKTPKPLLRVKQKPMVCLQQANKKWIFKYYFSNRI